MIHDNTTGTDTRQRVLDKREDATELASLASYLPTGPDRDLALACWGQGLTQATMGRLLGIGKEAVHRKLKKLKKRIQDPRFRFVALLPHEIPPRLRTFAKPRILEGLSRRATATYLGMTHHETRELDLELSQFITGYLAGYNATPSIAA